MQIIASAKTTNAILIYDAKNRGTLLKRRVIEGAQRPNGVALLPDRSDVLLVVERDGRRVTVVSVPELDVLHTFGQQDLKRPYGIDIVTQEPVSFTR